jgi:competence protein ComEC
VTRPGDDLSRPSATASRQASADAPEPDLRLAGFAVALWLAALASLYLSARWGLAVGGATFAAAAGVILINRTPVRLDASDRTLGKRWLVAAVLLGAGCGAVATAARVSVRDAAPLVALVEAGVTVRADVVVRDDPRALRGPPGLPPTYLVAIDLTSVYPEDGVRMRLGVRALVLGSDPAWRSLLPGQRASVTGRLLAPRGGDLRAAVLSVRGAAAIGRPILLDAACRGCAACGSATGLRTAA